MIAGARHADIGRGLYWRIARIHMYYGMCARSTYQILHDIVLVDSSPELHRHEYTMATSSECDLTTTAASKGASSHITPDRRKRAFRNLVSGVAEHLEKQEVNDICWQMDLPDFLQEKPALETLKWLVRQGKCSESDVQPLVQLLKDIHREDLAERVETFQKKFGKDLSITVALVYKS